MITELLQQDAIHVKKDDRLAHWRPPREGWLDCRGHLESAMLAILIFISNFSKDDFLSWSIQRIIRDFHCLVGGIRWFDEIVVCQSGSAYTIMEKCKKSLKKVRSKEWRDD